MLESLTLIDSRYGRQVANLKAEKLEDCSDGEEGRIKSESIFLVLMHECGVKEIQCRDVFTNNLRNFNFSITRL